MNALRQATGRRTRASGRYFGLPKVDTPQRAMERISSIIHSRGPQDQVKEAVQADTTHMVEVVRIIENDYDKFTHSAEILAAVAKYSANATARSRAVKVLGAYNERNCLIGVRDYTKFNDTQRAARRLVGTLGE